MKDIVIVGSSGFAKEVVFLIEEINRSTPVWNILGYINENVGELIGKYRVYNNDSWIEKTSLKLNIVIGIGNPSVIQKLASKLKKNPNLSFPNLIHPSVIGDFERIQFGEGNIVCAGNIFTTEINISSFNIFNLSCTIGHDTIIGNFNVFNPTVNISGNVNIEDENLVGTGSQVLEKISIKNKITIGAGAVVTKDLIESGVYVGIPTKKIK